MLSRGTLRDTAYFQKSFPTGGTQAETHVKNTKTISEPPTDLDHVIRGFRAFFQLKSIAIALSILSINSSSSLSS